MCQEGRAHGAFLHTHTQTKTNTKAKTKAQRELLEAMGTPVTWTVAVVSWYMRICKFVHVCTVDTSDYTSIKWGPGGPGEQ